MSQNHINYETLQAQLNTANKTIAQLRRKINYILRGWLIQCPNCLAHYILHDIYETA